MTSQLSISKERTHRDGRRNFVLPTLLSAHEALQDSGNPLDIY